MTRRIVIGKDFEVACWVANLAGGAWVPGQCTAIGLAELNAEGEGELIAGVVYDSFNGASVCMHVAAVPGARWMTKDYLRICFAYPFQQLKVNKILGVVGSGNAAARSFDEHLGFVLEATLKDAHPDGDLLLYTMSREQCRWLNTPEKVTSHGQAESSAAA